MHFLFSVLEVLHPNDAKQIGLHFWKSAVSMAQLGLVLRFSFDERNSEPWPDEAMAELWLAAAGGNVSRCLEWVRLDLFWYGEDSGLDPGSPRCQRIVEFIKQQAVPSPKQD